MRGTIIWGVILASGLLFPLHANSEASNPLCDEAFVVSATPQEIISAVALGADPNEMCIPDFGAWGPGRSTPLFAYTYVAGSEFAEGNNNEAWLDRITALLQAGADPNLLDARGDSILPWTVLFGDEQALEILLRYGADPNLDGAAALSTAAGGSVDFGGEPLSAAERTARAYSMVVLLLFYGANPNVPDENGQTAVHSFASGFSGNRVLDALLDHQADVNVSDARGRTPLHVAAARGSPQQVEALLDAGAITIVRDYDGHLPVDLVTENYTDRQEALYRLLSNPE